MNQNVPFIWRVNYRKKAASPETFLEIAHETARQYLRKTFPACLSIRPFRRTLTAAFKRTFRHPAQRSAAMVSENRKTILSRET